MGIRLNSSSPQKKGFWKNEGEREGEGRKAREEWERKTCKKRGGEGNIKKRRKRKREKQVRTNEKRSDESNALERDRCRITYIDLSFIQKETPLKAPTSLRDFDT